MADDCLPGGFTVAEGLAVFDLESPDDCLSGMLHEIQSTTT